MLSGGILAGIFLHSNLALLCSSRIICILADPALHLTALPRRPTGGSESDLGSLRDGLCNKAACLIGRLFHFQPEIVPVLGVGSRLRDFTYLPIRCSG